MQDYFSYHNNALCVEDVSLANIANQFGTPCYVYSRAAIEENWQRFNDGLSNVPHLICYAVKANSNIAILNLLANLGSGFDIVSGGELERVLAANGDPQKIVFSGVGKSTYEIKQALEADIYCFNVESESELERINAIAKQLNKIANIALRINPNVDARTHPYIATGLRENKFGIEIESALPICKTLKNFSHLNLVGLACHIGSQLIELNPLTDAIDRIIELAEKLINENLSLKHLDIGGGLGVNYQDEIPPTIEQYISSALTHLKTWPLKIIIAPGRAIMADAGILLTKVEYLKHTSHKNFAIVDAAMNDLARPSLYSAWQNIIPVALHSHTSEINYDIVGPICESADFLGKERKLNLTVGDYLAICTVGAYGFSMSSNYNSRPRAAEVLVDRDQAYLIRKREGISDLFAHESLLPAICLE